MTDQFKKVRPGDRLEIPARTFNAFIDAARDLQQRRHDRRSRAEPCFPHTGIVLVANHSGQDRSRFDVLGLEGPIVSPEDNLVEFERRPTFRGVRPSTAHRGRFVVLLEPLDAGRIGRAVVAGVSVVRLRVDDPLDGCCEIEPRQCHHLRSCLDGSAQILWKQHSGGTCWAIVRLGNCCEAEESSSSESWSESSGPSASRSPESLSESSAESASESLSESFSQESSGLTATVRVLVPEPYRCGDRLCFHLADLEFVDGLFQGLTPAGVTCHYLCCDESLGDDSSSDESTSGW